MTWNRSAGLTPSKDAKWGKEIDTQVAQADELVVQYRMPSNCAHPVARQLLLLVYLQPLLELIIVLIVGIFVHLRSVLNSLPVKRCECLSIDVKWICLSFAMIGIYRLFSLWFVSNKWNKPQLELHSDQSEHAMIMISAPSARGTFLATCLWKHC